MRSEKRGIIMAIKRVVFVIVEGPTDRDALEILFDRIFDRQEVIVHVQHGDITSDTTTNASNVIARVTQTVKNYAKNNYLKRTDFAEVIHITDTDGAFIPPDAVIADNTVTRPTYSPTEIRTKNKSSIEDRNRRKSENINRLISQSSIWTDIPYRLFYMSCNLDHVLHNKLNSSDDEKQNDAHKFAAMYRENIPDFMRFITESDFTVCGNYRETWDFIAQDLHSLERHTNLGLCFPEITSE